MYGDFAPIKVLNELMNQYKKFNLYIDDAHGMGWTGKNGRGYILSQVELNTQMVLATSLNKAFGAGGGVFLFKDKVLRNKVKDCGNSFVFSAPHSLPIMGAAIASAKIFLSPEIYEMQTELGEKINYCHALLRRNNLPVVSNPKGPIFFIGVGLTRVGYNIVNRILRDGCYVNISMWPAVPETCTGIRFTITNHHTLTDIERLVEAIAYHFPKALEEEGRTMTDINRAFRKVIDFEHLGGNTPIVSGALNYRIQHETTIHNIPSKIWDNLLGNRGSFNWNGLVFLESAFKDNQEPEHNWDFHYYIIWDNFNKPVLATFFTGAIVKDDIFSSAKVSKKIEIERSKNPFYLTSYAFMMGSLFTEGNHLYIDKSRQDWKKILMILLDNVWKEQDKQNATILNYRDLDKNDEELSEFFKDQGFIMIHLPENHQVNNSAWETDGEYLRQLKQENRYYVKKNALKYESTYEVNIINTPSDKQLEDYYKLYKNIAQKNFEINIFNYPFNLFKTIAKDPNWEFIELKLKPEFDNREERLPIGFSISYKTKDNYCFLLTGMDYNYLESYKLYAQILWQIMKRSNTLNAKTTYLGLTASQNKRKFGARATSTVAFIQMKDSYNMSVIDLINDKAEI